MDNQDDNGFTALIHASSHGDIVSMLLGAGQCAHTHSGSRTH